jgi:hypothetical protein
MRSVTIQVLLDLLEHDWVCLLHATNIGFSFLQRIVI